MKTKQLSELEQEVMNIVWELKNCSVREVRAELSKSKKLAYTTVATILQRLNDKGVVARKGLGQTYSYAPKFSKAVYSKNIAQSFIQKFFSSYGDNAIASFAETLDKLPSKKKKHLLKLLSDNGK